MSATLTSGTYPRRSSTRSLPAVGLFQQLWQALVAMGQRRAAAHMAVLAAQHRHTNPALAAELREAARGVMNG